MASSFPDRCIPLGQWEDQDWFDTHPSSLLLEESDLAMEAAAGVRACREGREVFSILRSSKGEEFEERYSRKDKSLSQLSKRFLAEFGLGSNQLISMFEVTDRLSREG